MFRPPGFPTGSAGKTPGKNIQRMMPFPQKEQAKKQYKRQKY
jgi:hypothetical protein